MNTSREVVKSVLWLLFVVGLLLPLWLPMAVVRIAWHLARNVEQTVFE